MYNIVENYMSNVDEVMTLVKKHEDKFRVRDGGQSFRTDYGDARLKQIHQDFMPEELREAIFRTIPIKWTDRLNYCIRCKN